METFRDKLKVGDKVIIGWKLNSSKKVTTVTKVTKTQVTTASGTRYMKSTGREIGGSFDRWSSRSLIEYTEEKAKVLEEESTRRSLVDKVHAVLRHFDSGKFTNEELEEVLVFLNKEK